MVYRSKFLKAAVLAATALTASTAFAADLDEVIFADDANFVKPAELGSSWYIRGELGINLNGKHDVDSSGSALDDTFTDNNFTDGFNYSIGAGKRINQFLRLEANLGRLAGSDATSSQLVYAAGTEPAGTDPSLVIDPDVPGVADSFDPVACNGTGEYIDLASGTSYLDSYFISNCVRSDRVEYDTTFAMVNAYVDLPKVFGVQPFIGGGLGIGRVSWSQETSRYDCTPQSADLHLEGCVGYGSTDQPDPNTAYTQAGTVSEGVGYRLGYQVAGGLAYEFTDNLTMETMYKYTHYGKGDFKASDGAELASEGFSVHQVNLGLRYSFF